MDIFRSKYQRKLSLIIGCIVLAAVLFTVCPIPNNMSYAADETAILMSGLDIVSVVDKVDKSVVGIIGKVSSESKMYSEYSDNIASGSGIVYKRNGYIITNAHVVMELESIYVVLSNQRVYEAYVVAIDEPSDLALIKINKGMLKPVKFADSGEVKTGAMVLALGTPLAFDLQNSVSIGIISGVNRIVSDISMYGYIQTDASANPGSSGGPIVNMNGDVIGIIAGGYTMYQGLTFCIPSDTIEYVMSHFEKYGRVNRPYIGAKFVQSTATDYGLPSDTGIWFTDIEEDKAAATAGIIEDDALRSINGAQIKSVVGYNEEMKKYLPGDIVTVLVERDGALMEFRVELGEEE